jgi:hypothetical protein
MARRKLTWIVTPNTLESMIENMLISNVLNKICEMTKKTFGICKRWHLVNPPLAFVRNYNRGNKMENDNWQMVQSKPMVVMLDLIVEFEWRTINMSPIGHVPKHGLFCTFNFISFWSWKVHSN